MSWLAVGGATQTIRDVSAGRDASAVTTHADTECGPGGPTRCDHGGDHRAAGRLHPSVTSQDGGTGYPADDPAATVDQHSPATRPPARPSLAELQVWRR